MKTRKYNMDRTLFLCKTRVFNLPEIVLRSWSACDPRPYVPKGQWCVTSNHSCVGRLEGQAKKNPSLTLRT
jgi:hypothetical protein